jgi:hypothetical protein
MVNSFPIIYGNYLYLGKDHSSVIGDIFVSKFCRQILYKKKRKMQEIYNLQLEVSVRFFLLVKFENKITEFSCP